MPRRTQPKAVLIGSMLTLSIGQAGCETDIVAASIALIEVEPAEFSLAVGEQKQLNVELLDDSGNSLVGYPITWQSNNEAVAFVDAQGGVQAVGEGVAEISARVDGTVGASIVTVTPSPSIGLSPQSVTFAATIGGPAPGTRMVRISNAGPGTLSGLTASISYGDGQAAGWLTFAFDSPAAPTDLRLVATTDGLSSGTYDAAVTIHSAHPGVTPRVLPVQLILGEPLPVIDIETESITFNMVAGGTLPDPVAIAITNVGGGTLTGLGASITYAQGQPTGWLSTSLTPSTAPATLSVSLAGSLGIGTYNAEIAIVAAQAANSPRTLEVTLVVQEAPRIGLSGSARSFTAQEGSADPSSQSVLVNNIGGGQLIGLNASVQYQAGQPTGWLTANLTSTTAPATLVLVPSLGSLAAGTYSAVVLISAPAASNSPQAVQVTFTVTPPPASIVLSRDTVTFEATVGDPAPAAVEVQISNGGGGILDGLTANVVYGPGASDWLDAALSAPTAPATLTLTADPGLLAEGSYSATVTVVATASTARVIDVQLIVSPPEPQPEIGLSTMVAAFEAIEGGADPTPFDVQVTNTGDGELTGLAASVTYGDGEPTDWLGVGLDGETAPATLTLTATLGSLAPGEYTATVSVEAPEAANSPQVVQVTFDVQPAPPTTPPAAPSGLQTNSQGEDSIGLTWQDNSDDETHFIVQRSPTDVEDQSVWVFSAELPPDTSEYTHTDLAEETEYRLRVLACNASGCSASEVVTAQTDD